MKKKHYILFCLVVIKGYAQVAISTTPSDHDPHPNAILDVKSTIPAKAVLLPSVSQISNAANPVGDDTFKGALVYSKSNASIYEHDGTRWRSTYDYVVETKPQYLAHFSMSNNTSITCNALGGCSIEGTIPLFSNGSSDFTGSLISLSLANNEITANEAGVYRITYRSNATFNGPTPNINSNVNEIQIKLQKASASAPGTFSTIDYQSFTSDNARLGYTPVFNGSIVTRLNVGDKIRLNAFMQSAITLFPTTVTAFFNNNPEIIFEKVVL